MRNIHVERVSRMFRFRGRSLQMGVSPREAADWDVKGEFAFKSPPCPVCPLHSRELDSGHLLPNHFTPDHS